MCHVYFLENAIDDCVYCARLASYEGRITIIVYFNYCRDFLLPSSRERYIGSYYSPDVIAIFMYYDRPPRSA